MAETWNDTGIPIGSVTLTINSVTYICESFEVARTVEAKKRLAADGTPGGSFGIADFPTYTATLQKAASATAMPPLGQTFSYTDDATVGAETWYVQNVSTPRQAGEAVKFTISGIKKIN